MTHPVRQIFHPYLPLPLPSCFFSLSQSSGRKYQGTTKLYSTLLLELSSLSAHSARNMWLPGTPNDTQHSTRSSGPMVLVRCMIDVDDPLGWRRRDDDLSRAPLCTRPVVWQLEYNTYHPVPLLLVWFRIHDCERTKNAGNIYLDRVIPCLSSAQATFKRLISEVSIPISVVTSPLA
ncbi:hypothetical protein ARMGADRAFT_803858 [Armillaria gallica]|uniref:Uncharacterized protein n=1 Tax=Armillaria gallica TaxID=47427 RepID=A0A2H3E7B2_ARMGA|nr:hypothetical protein ARMGADRAFT_803858 [Armillaria gallica]